VGEAPLPLPPPKWVWVARPLPPWLLQEGWFRKVVWCGCVQMAALASLGGVKHKRNRQEGQLFRIKACCMW
jgi:hypothetical protein